MRVTKQQVEIQDRVNQNSNHRKQSKQCSNSTILNAIHSRVHYFDYYTAKDQEEVRIIALNQKGNDPSHKMPSWTLHLQS